MLSSHCSEFSSAVSVIDSKWVPSSAFLHLAVPFMLSGEHEIRVRRVRGGGSVTNAAGGGGGGESGKPKFSSDAADSPLALANAG